MLYPVLTQSRLLSDLSGVWNFKLDNGKGFEEKWYEKPLKDADTMPVPASYNDLKEGTDFRDHYGWVFYQRNISVPEYVKSQRIVLRCAAVTHYAMIYLNGKLICEHKGGFLPFEVELNDHLQDGDNLLTIAVNNVIDYTTLPVGGKANMMSGMMGGMGAGASDKPQNNPNFDFFNYCGITGIFFAPGLHFSERQAHLIPDDAAVGRARHALAHEAELRVVVHEPVLAREHEAAAALRARVGDGALDELSRIAVPAVVWQRVHAEDHLPRAVRVVQRGVRGEVVREVGAVRDHAVHERDERAAVKHQPEVVAIVRQPVSEFFPCRGLRRREARCLHRRHGVEISKRRRANHPSIHRYASVSSSSSAASSATVRQ